MPLPTDRNTEWPPGGLDAARRAMDEATAWWTGDHDALTRFYAAAPSAPASALTRDRLWQQPHLSDGRRRVHVPVAADVAQAGADLLFGDQVDLHVAGARQANPA